MGYYDKFNHIVTQLNLCVIFARRNMNKDSGVIFARKNMNKDSGT